MDFSILGSQDKFINAGFVNTSQKSPSAVCPSRLHAGVVGSLLQVHPVGGLLAGGFGEVISTAPCHVFLLRRPWGATCFFFAIWMMELGAMAADGQKKESTPGTPTSWALGTGHWAGYPFLWKVTTQRDTSLIPTWLPVRDVLTATSRDRHAYLHTPHSTCFRSADLQCTTTNRHSHPVRRSSHHTAASSIHPSVHRPLWRRRSAST